MIRDYVRRTIAMLGLAIAGISAQPATAAPKPAMWEVTDRDTKIYLFGTIHLLPQNSPWRTKTFDKIVARSQNLVVETIVDERNPQAFAAMLMRMGTSSPVPPIATRVAPEKRALLETAIAKSGIPRPTFDKMETWAAAFMLLGNQFRQLEISGSQGVEAVLREGFTRSGKPIGELESNFQQMSFFDTLPEAAQRTLLEGSIETPTDTRKSFDVMLNAWLRGDLRSIATTFNEDMASSPELRDALIRRRNANWANWVERRMASPGTTLLAVGAGHLAGPDSVIEMLQRDGYRVRRIQ